MWPLAHTSCDVHKLLCSACIALELLGLVCSHVCSVADTCMPPVASGRENLPKRSSITIATGDCTCMTTYKSACIFQPGHGGTAFCWCALQLLNDKSVTHPEITVSYMLLPHFGTSASLPRHLGSRRRYCPHMKQAQCCHWAATHHSSAAY